MDRTRALRMAAELKGRSLAGWLIADLVDNGKSALALTAAKNGKTCILKVFDPEIVERYGLDVQRERVSRERALIGKFHPHLVEVLDAGEDGEFFFVAMKRVPGKPLSKCLSELPRTQIWPLIGQVADAAKFLESLKFAHRDIKPDNILVTDDFSAAVLLDLGVIKPFVGTVVTDSEKLPFIGTLQYSSPEFLKRREDPTEDGWRALTFYQLGAVLHDMIMRKRIFSDYEEPFGRLVDAVTYENPEIKATDVPPRLVSLARTCLSKKPEHRLAYINWAHFCPPDPREPAIVGLRERVKLNAEAALGVRIDIEDLAEKQRSIRAKTSRLQVQIERLVHEETIGNGLFPPVSTHQYPSQNNNVATTAFSFAVAPSLGLANRLHLILRTSLVDAGCELVEIECAALLSSQNGLASPPEVSEIEGEKIFVGAFEVALVRDRVDLVLYSALAQAQAAKAEVGGEVLFLKLSGNDA
jgi:eukaryotic-like serine/threonine-protein kinase